MSTPKNALPDNQTPTEVLAEPSRATDIIIIILRMALAPASLPAGIPESAESVVRLYWDSLSVPWEAHSISNVSSVKYVVSSLVANLIIKYSNMNEIKKDCGEIVASKFFPVDSEDGNSQHPLCERDYFRRLNLLCFECGGALRGSYITALDHKYHIEHFTCSVCPTVFGAQDSYYEHEGKVYCHYHYSTQFAQRCNGCQTAILKQFVEIFRNGQNQHWHPECYMIHKFWNVRLSPSGKTFEPPEIDRDVSNEERDQIRDEEEKMEEKVYRIWSVLSAFEESSAACISDMLLHVSNGAYIDGVVVAKKFIFHVEVLFKGTDQLASQISALGVKGKSSNILLFFSSFPQTIGYTDHWE